MNSSRILNAVELTDIGCVEVSGARGYAAFYGLVEVVGFGARGERG
jgi:hypothetical protein